MPVRGTSSRAGSRRRQLLDAAIAVMQRTGFHEMSMQALADEAAVSVGLVYKYFAGKEDLLLAAILDILDAFREQLPPAMEAAGPDPVQRLAAGLRRYVEIIDANVDAVLLTYRESKTLSPGGRQQIKELEVRTAEPLRHAVHQGIATGVLAEVDVDLAVYDLMMLAHAWALKRWHFAGTFTVESYIRAQTALLLRALLNPDRTADYRHLLGGNS
ncbi:MAG: TetR/AcrR family transcriptional regulator [Actinomycetota bacterium]|nr:TetR/AcrR family transcriptional regulator [Actinomycetota bacterium]